MEKPRRGIAERRLAAVCAATRRDPPLKGPISLAHFSLTDLSNRSGEVVEAASRGPVEITRRGKRKFVLLTAEDYDRLVSAADTRRAFHADDAPEEVAAMMLAALEDDDG
jgi:prevent-host-death family protein